MQIHHGHHDPALSPRALLSSFRRIRTTSVPLAISSSPRCSQKFFLGGRGRGSFSPAAADRLEILPDERIGEARFLPSRRPPSGFGGLLLVDTVQLCFRPPPNLAADWTARDLGVKTLTFDRGSQTPSVCGVRVLRGRVPRRVLHSVEI